MQRPHTSVKISVSRVSRKSMLTGVARYSKGRPLRRKARGKVKTVKVSISKLKNSTAVPVSSGIGWPAWVTTNTMHVTKPINHILFTIVPAQSQYDWATTEDSHSVSECFGGTDAAARSCFARRGNVHRQNAVLTLEQEKIRILHSSRTPNTHKIVTVSFRISDEVRYGYR